MSGLTPAFAAIARKAEGAKGTSVAETPKYLAPAETSAVSCALVGAVGEGDAEAEGIAAPDAPVTADTADDPEALVWVFAAVWFALWKTQPVNPTRMTTLTTAQARSRTPRLPADRLPGFRRVRELSDIRYHRQREQCSTDQVGDGDHRVAGALALEARLAGAPAGVVRAAEETEQAHRQQDQRVDRHEDRQVEQVFGREGEVAREAHRYRHQRHQHGEADEDGRLLVPGAGQRDRVVHPRAAPVRDEGLHPAGEGAEQHERDEDVDRVEGREEAGLPDHPAHHPQRVVLGPAGPPVLLFDQLAQPRRRVRVDQGARLVDGLVPGHQRVVRQRPVVADLDVHAE